jgi:hypothetical protein
VTEYQRFNSYSISNNEGNFKLFAITYYSISKSWEFYKVDTRYVLAVMKTMTTLVVIQKMKRRPSLRPIYKTFFLTVSAVSVDKARVFVLCRPY